jgi:hypothetical protein
MSELRAISTRAEITPTSFINEYQWGNLKANPLDLMKKYFDAHVYVANWGTFRLMLKFPRDLVDVDAARDYCNDETVFVHIHRERVIFTFEANDEHYDFLDSPAGWLPSLLPLRDGLMQGDFRSLYLGWLAGVWDLEDEPEPPIPPGLGQLSGSLWSLAHFLSIDPHLLDAASEGDTTSPPAAPSPEDIDTWISRRPVSEKNGLLARLLSGVEPAPYVLAELRQQFQKDWNTENCPAAASTSRKRRTAADLFRKGDALAEEEQRREEERKAKEKAKLEKKAAAARKRYLKQVAGREDEIWCEVESLLATTGQKNYDRAVALLGDLRDVPTASSTNQRWHQRVAEYRRRYSRKSSLMSRFDAAGFPS